MQTLSTINLPAKLENLESVQRSVAECARSQGFDPSPIGRMELALEEAWVNICNYAYPQKSGDVEINCKRYHDRFIIEIIDSGIAFDITARPDPEFDADVTRRKIGGFGVLLIKKSVDAVHYRRENNRNILTLIMELKKDPQ